MDEQVRSAFTTLGLPPGARPTVVKRRYKALVRRWHPDRFVGDAAAATAANARMRAINVAFEIVAGTWAGGPPVADHQNGHDPQPSRDAAAAFLGRDEIDAIVTALNRKETFWELVKRDPLNRGCGTAFVIANTVYVLLTETIGANYSPLSVFSLLISPVLLTYVWSDSRASRWFGWFSLLTFSVVFELFAWYLHRQI